MRSYKILFSPFESVSKLLLISEEAMLGFLFQGGFEIGGFFYLFNLGTIPLTNSEFFRS